jgi:hypothetical protein
MGVQMGVQNVSILPPYKYPDCTFFEAINAKNGVINTPVLIANSHFFVFSHPLQMACIAILQDLKMLRCAGRDFFINTPVSCLNC